MKIQPICYYQKKLFCLTHDDKQYLFLAQFKNKILGHIKNDDFYKVKVDFFCITKDKEKDDDDDGGDESALALLFKSQKLFKRAMKKMTERCTFVEGKIKRLQAEVCTTRVETEELERELATLQRF